MSKKSISRREFVGLTTVAAALGATSSGPKLEADPVDAVSVEGTPPLDRKLGTDAEMAMAEDWARSFTGSSVGTQATAVSRLFPEVILPPFSFVYGGRNSSDLLPGWKVEVKAADADITQQMQEVIYTDPATGLLARATAIIFKDFPAVEWVMHFQNAGAADTPILENVQPLDALLRCADGDPTVHYAKGATCSMDDFMPLTRVLSPNGRLHLEPGGGRSSSEFLPFFNVEAKDEGVVVAIGWSGEWAATYSHPDPGAAFHVQAGMALTHLKLHSGEEIRTPRILTLFWQGEPRRGNNLLRQFILAHHRPTAGGKPVQAPITIGNWGGTPAADHLENIRQIVAHDLPMDYYWIDAEWFGNGPWWQNPGNWEVKRDLYPQGFKPISDLLHSSGRKLLLWFEPERVCAGTPWYTEHADWLLEVPNDRKVFRGFGAKGDWDVATSDPRWVPNESARNQFQDGDKLFNLAIPEARQFLTDFISARIDEFGLDCFRNDANIAPLEFWRAADAPDRQGMTEIRWVEGFYAFWDELRRRHPNLIIDDCASGGRRIDLETIGRSTALSRTDFVGHLEADQCHTYGLLQWVALNTTGAGNLSTHNEYRIRSSMTAGLGYGIFSAGDVPQPKPGNQGIPFAAIKKSLEQYQSIQKYFYGDYYPLTEYTQASDAWVAYQLDLPDTGEGLVVIVKRPLSTFTQAVFPLNALSAGAAYGLTNLDTGESRTLTGRELVEKGVEARLLQRPDTAVFRYRRKA
jgi:alpha-galactosidase